MSMEKQFDKFLKHHLHHLDDILKQIEKHNEDLRARAKPYESLIVPIECSVQHVNGSRKKTTLEVLTQSPVKTLTFYGLPPLEKGDMIRAYVFKGEELHEKLPDDPFSLNNHPWGRKKCYSPMPPSHYVERDLQAKEAAVRIEKIRNNEVVATYRSIPHAPPARHSFDDHMIIGSE